MEIKEAGSFAGWLVALQGIIAIIFGLVILMWPGITVAIMVYAFAFYMFFQSFVSLGYGISFRNNDPAWWTYIVEAVLGFIFGIVVLVWPAISAMALVYFIGAWAVVVGIVRIITGLIDRENWTGKLLASVVGVLFIVFGLFLFASPGQGAIAMIKVIGLFNIMIGVFSFFLAFQVKALGADLDVAVNGKPAKKSKRK